MYITLIIILAFITAVYSAKTLIFSLVEGGRDKQILSGLVLAYSLITIAHLWR